MAATGLILNVKLQIMGDGVDLDVQLKTPGAANDRCSGITNRFGTIIKTRLTRANALLDVDTEY